MTWRFSVAALFLVAAGGGRLIAAEVDDRVYSVCEVLAVPVAFNGKVVRVRGVVMSGDHGTWLESADCPAPFAVGEDTLPRGIVLAYQSEFGKSPVRNVAHMQQVEKQIRKKRGKWKSAHLVLTYTGIFETRTEWQVLSFREGGSRLLGFGHKNAFPAQLVVMDFADPAFVKRK